MASWRRWTEDDLETMADERYHQRVEDGLVPSGAERERRRLTDEAPEHPCAWDGRGACVVPGCRNAAK